MTALDALATATTAHRNLLEAQRAAAQATTERDAAVVEARRAGESAISIAEALALSRQQVHKILDRVVPPALQALRDEVTEELHGLSYSEIMPGDRAHLDAIIAERAAQRGVATSAFE